MRLGRVQHSPACAARSRRARRPIGRTVPVMPSVAELRSWFEEQVVENHRLFYSIAYQVLRDAHEAEDAVQTAVCKAWSNLGELHDPAAVVGWVAKITRHTAIDMGRKRREVVTDD